jgi:hypothetical protein
MRKTVVGAGTGDLLSCHPEDGYALGEDSSGIRDQFGHDLTFPSAFRLSRREYRPKGIVRIVR